MKKNIFIALFFIGVFTACTPQPIHSGAGTNQTTSTLSGNDVTALAFKFDSLFSVHVGDTYRINNSDINSKKQKEIHEN